MNRRSLLGRLFGGAATAIVAPMALAGGKPKFVVPEKLTAKHDFHARNTIAGAAQTHLFSASSAAFVGDIRINGVVADHVKQAILEGADNELIELSKSEAQTIKIPNVSKTEICWSFLGVPCVLPRNRLRCTNSSEESATAILEGIRDAARRDIDPSMCTNWIDPGPHAEFVAKWARKAQELCSA